MQDICGSSCGRVDRAVASDIRGSSFETTQSTQNFHKEPNQVTPSVVKKLHLSAKVLVDIM